MSRRANSGNQEDGRLSEINSRLELLVCAIKNLFEGGSREQANPHQEPDITR